MTSLVEKLKSLGVNIGLSDFPTGRVINPDYSLEKVFSFKTFETEYGISLYTELNTGHFNK